jgi:hypothetical protein
MKYTDANLIENINSCVSEVVRIELLHDRGTLKGLELIGNFASDLLFFSEKENPQIKNQLRLWLLEEFRLSYLFA